MKYQLILRCKPLGTDTVIIDGRSYTGDEILQFKDKVVEAEHVSDTLTDAGSFWVKYEAR
jgi:hypothetical protein